MSIDQYQRDVNRLDKEIADLNKKKADADKKAAEYQKKAGNIRISRNSSMSSINSKIRQQQNYIATCNKAAEESAKYSKQIADKTKKRADAQLKLQREQEKIKKEQDRSISAIKNEYQHRIMELQSKLIADARNTVVSDKSIESEYDVFISHAWEDKEDFVDDLVQALLDRDIKVWYDKKCIGWGDSMRASIDAGLKKSKFGIVVLSPNYIAKDKYWTKSELDGLFQLESVNGKTILPIWHKLTKQNVMDFSPTIAGKKALSTAWMTAEEIADELVKLLSREDI